MQDIRIAFIGDSFVNGAGDSSFLGWVGRVCQVTQKMNSNIELTAYNLGIRRETSVNILERFEYEIDARLKDGDKLIIVFSFGVNDCVLIDGKQRVSYEQSNQNLKLILNKANEKSNDIVFVMPPPIADNKMNQSIQKLISLYAQTCDELNIGYINLFDELSQNDIWTNETKQNDGAHPQVNGYELFANLILENEIWRNLWK